MNKVVSLRLDDEEIEILKLYRGGKVSAGKASKDLGMSISEFIDLLRELGIKSPVEYEDFLSAQKTMKKIW